MHTIHFTHISIKTVLIHFTHISIKSVLQRTSLCCRSTPIFAYEFLFFHAREATPRKHNEILKNPPILTILTMFAIHCEINRMTAGFLEHERVGSLTVSTVMLYITQCHVITLESSLLRVAVVNTQNTEAHFHL